jgi:hypothetical protein
LILKEYNSKEFIYCLPLKDSSPVGKVKLLDITLRNVAPVNMYTVVLKNVKQDEVVNLNTGLDTRNMLVAITGAVFTMLFLQQQHLPQDCMVLILLR